MPASCAVVSTGFQCIHIVLNDVFVDMCSVLVRDPGTRSEWHIETFNEGSCQCHPSSQARARGVARESKLGDICHLDDVDGTAFLREGSCATDSKSVGAHLNSTQSRSHSLSCSRLRSLSLSLPLSLCLCRVDRDKSRSHGDRPFIQGLEFGKVLNERYSLHHVWLHEAHTPS